MTVTSPAIRDGARDFFLAPYQGAGTPGPMIVDGSGNLIWFHPLASGLDATDFRTQSYGGQPVLTWWQGRILRLGFGQGEDEIYDDSYQPIATVVAGNGTAPTCTVPVDAFWHRVDRRVRARPLRHLARRRRRDGVSATRWCRRSTSAPAWSCGSGTRSATFRCGDSYAPAAAHSHPWYYAHVNSVDPSRAGQVLISARNTWTIYDVDLHSGAVRWRLGGKRSSFRLGPGAAFHYQHDAAWQPGGLVSVFDNGRPPRRSSRAGCCCAPTSPGAPSRSSRRSPIRTRRC